MTGNGNISQKQEHVTICFILTADINSTVDVVTMHSLCIYYGFSEGKEAFPQTNNVCKAHLQRLDDMTAKIQL